MKHSLSNRRQVENEAVFRSANERVQHGLEHEKSVALSEGFNVSDIDELALHFYCECSDENCIERIIMKLKEYKAIHQNRKQFIISPGHEVPRIEDTVAQKPEFSVVKKHVVPPENNVKLQETNTHNV